MTNKTVETIDMVLNDLNPSAKKLIIVPEGVSFPNGNVAIIVLQHNFNIEDTIAAIANIKYIGIINAELFNRTKLSELINILTNTNKSTVIRLNASPVSCKVFYPVPRVGTKYIKGNYEYTYGSYFNFFNMWQIDSDQCGWGVRVIDNAQTDYASPLTMIQGYPVTNMSWLFSRSPATTLNLIDWDTSNITNMRAMFNESKAINISGLSRFDTSNVTNMSHMFCESKSTNLDLSSFNTSKVRTMNFMMAYVNMSELDLSSFNTSKVRTMNFMMAYVNISELDLSSFDTSNVADMECMFVNSQIPNLDLHSFTFHEDNSARAMFARAKVKTLVLSSMTTSSYYISNTQIPKECEIETL